MPEMTEVRDQRSEIRWGERGQRTVRIIILAIAVIFASQVLRKDLAAILPSISPFLAVFSAIATRSITPIFLLCLPVLVFSLLKGRWFCRYMCPTGLLAEYAGRLGRRSNAKPASLPCLGQYIVLLALGGALLGYPFFLWLDPLSIFNGFVSVWHRPITLLTVLPGIGLFSVLLLSIWRPNAWCYRLCPLGFTQELLGRVRHQVRCAGQGAADAASSASRGPLDRFITGRRGFLSALLLFSAGAAGLWMRRTDGRKLPVIRPPGSIDEDKFNAVCVRCGNCINACPSGIIRPDLGEAGLTGLLTPIVRIELDYCSEWCNECNKVCPTNAIAHITLEEKRTVSIGTARVTKSHCLAWNEAEYCMVCDEYCPYHAVKIIEHNGVNCPEVDPDICRGCGLCQTVCPAVPEKAIIVQAKPQRKLAPVAL